MADKLQRSQQTLDQLHLLELEQPGLMDELVRLFVADAPRQMRSIESSYSKRDPEGLRQSAHFLRSGALALGLTWIAETGLFFEHLELEQYGSKASDEALAQFRQELHQVLLTLLKELKAS